MAELARRELLLVDPLEGSDLLFELLSSRAQGRAAGHLRRLDSAQRHRPRAREGGDRGELPHAARRPGRSPRRAPPPRPDHRLGRRPDPGHRPGRGHRADEHAGGAAVQRAGIDDEAAQRRVRANGAQPHVVRLERAHPLAASSATAARSSSPIRSPAGRSGRRRSPARSCRSRAS